MSSRLMGITTTNSREFIREEFFLPKSLRNGKKVVLSIVHILGVASIHHGNGITFDGVCVIPFISVSHIITFPSTDGRLAAQ